jgi:hypothetical protein
MANETDPLDDERKTLILCVEEAYEALRLIPGLDANGPAVVWLAEHLLEARHRLANAG